MTEELTKAEKLARKMHNIISGGQSFNKQVAAQVRDELRRLDEEGSWKATHEYCEKLWEEERAVCLDKINDLRARLATAEKRAWDEGRQAAADACNDEYFREMSSISDTAVMAMCDKQMETSTASIMALPNPYDKETGA